MQFTEIQNELVTILVAAQGRFLTAYQICQRLNAEHHPLWRQLTAEYPSVRGTPPMGEGTGHHYSPASFVANALRYFVANDQIHGLRQELLECDGVSFNGIDPGHTEMVIGIWAIQG